MNPVITEEDEEGEWVIADDADEDVLDELIEQMETQDEPAESGQGEAAT